MNYLISTYGQTTLNAAHNGTFMHSSSTGKERDEETGYTYHGARYFDAALLTSWMAVDPMSDKYPSLSPYNYCDWNPIKLVDPDGMDIDWYKNAGGSVFWKDCSDAKVNFNGETYYNIGTSYIQTLDGGQKVYYGNSPDGFMFPEPIPNGSSYTSDIDMNSLSDGFFMIGDVGQGLGRGWSYHPKTPRPKHGKFTYNAGRNKSAYLLSKPLNKKPGQIKSMLNTNMPRFSKISGRIGAAGMVVNIGGGVIEDRGVGINTFQAANSSATGFVGGELGFEIGAAIGSFICPGLGSAIGGALGGVLGGYYGGELGEWGFGQIFGN